MERHNRAQELVPIGTVVERLREAYPDVSHSSLRFLEREGLITPTRTPGGHRLFTPADLERIRQIKEWQALRMSLEEIRGRLDERDSVSSPDGLAEQFLTQALAGDLEGAQRTILHASDVGLPVELLFTDVLRPALWELGRRWEAGEATVAQEKEVSHVARELIAELSLRVASVPDDSADVVAACVSGERHELGLLMVSGLLRKRGVSVHYLGQDVDPDFLVDAVRRRRPQAVLLSATGVKHLPAIQATVDALRDAGLSASVLAGGQAVEQQRDLITSWGVTPIAFEDIDRIDALAASLLDQSSKQSSS